MPLCAVDTNVLAYAAGLGHSSADRPKVAIAKALLSSIVADDAIVLPAQVCFELHHVLVRKRGLKPGAAAKIVRDYVRGSVVVGSDLQILEAALDLTARHQFQTYDAVILASAGRAGCALLFSEDMQHGFEWQGVRIVDPFA